MQRHRFRQAMKKLKIKPPKKVNFKSKCVSVESHKRTLPHKKSIYEIYSKEYGNNWTLIETEVFVKHFVLNQDWDPNKFEMFLVYDEIETNTFTECKLTKQE